MPAREKPDTFGRSNCSLRTGCCTTEAGYTVARTDIVATSSMLLYTSERTYMSFWMLTYKTRISLAEQPRVSRACKMSSISFNIPTRIPEETLVSDYNTYAQAIYIPFRMFATSRQGTFLLSDIPPSETADAPRPHPTLGSDALFCSPTSPRDTTCQHNSFA